MSFWLQIWNTAKTSFNKIGYGENDISGWNKWTVLDNNECYRLLLKYCLLVIVWVGWLVGFYGLSNLDGYLMPNHVYTYILNLYDLESDNLLVTIFSWARIHLFAFKYC